MKRLLLLTALLLAGCAAPKEEFSFRKTQLFLHDTKLEKERGGHPMIDFERERLQFGTVTASERAGKEGHYLNFWWKARRPANVTVRLEYRQQNTGARVHVREIDVPNARGTVETKFQITGDDYHKNGRIIAWRALLIENGKVVAQTRSFLWK